MWEQTLHDHGQLMSCNLAGVYLLVEYRNEYTRLSPAIATPPTMDDLQPVLYGALAVIVAVYLFRWRNDPVREALITIEFTPGSSPPPAPASQDPYRRRTLCPDLVLSVGFQLHTQQQANS